MEREVALSLAYGLLRLQYLEFLVGFLPVYGRISRGVLLSTLHQKLLPLQPFSIYISSPWSEIPPSQSERVTPTPKIYKNKEQKPEERGISIKALRIPVVAEYSFSQFFLSIAFYCSFFLFPYIIKNSEIEGVSCNLDLFHLFDCL